MAATEVLRRELDFEDVIGTGKTFPARDRSYLRFADDLSLPRLTFSTEDLKDYALRSQARRRFYEDLSDAAQAQGVSLSAYAYSQGAHQKAPDTSGLLSPFHDEQVHSEGLRREAVAQQRNAAHAARMAETASQWQRGHEEPTTIEAALQSSPNQGRGPAETVGEAVGRTTGAVLNRVGSGGRSGVADHLAKKGGGAIGSTAGRAIDSVGSTMMGAASAVGSVFAEAFGPDLAYEPPKEIPRKIQQGGRLRPRRNDL